MSMPAYNTERYIGEAIKSILAQDDIEFELIIVDDKSSDSTLSVAESFNDPRIKILTNDRRMGIGYCHNKVIKNCNSEIICHVDSDDYILKGSLKKMYDSLVYNADNYYSFCYYHKVDEHSSFLYKGTNDYADRIKSLRKPGMDFKRGLLRRGMIANHFRTYRREVFKVVGKFNEKIKFGTDYEMALRIADKLNMCLVPEFLYFYRIHSKNTVQRMMFANLRFWIQRWSMYYRLRNTGVSFLRQSRYNPYIYLLLNTYKIFKTY